MALVLKDRVKETTTVVGTGTATLLGAATGYQSFAAIGNGNTCYYTIAAQTTNEWEVGIGTYTSSGTTLSRDTVLASSNSGNLVNFTAGTKDVFVTQPAEKAVYADASDIVNAFGNGANTITFAEINTTNLSASTVTLTAGTITTNAANATDITNKQYVDGLFSTGISYHDPVRVESPTALSPVTYNNGSSGVGATLTNAGTQTALVIDGITLSLNDRVLVYTQTDQKQNGIYYVSNVGSGSTNWVLTRATDADSYGLADPNALGQGDAVFVQQGNTGAGETYVCNTPGTIVFGTTNITFVQISTAQIYAAGTGLNLSNLTFSIANTTVVTGLYGDSANVAVIEVNPQGQLTSASNAAINVSNITVGTLSNDRTTANSSNGANTIVLRDSTGSFNANVVTATTVNATTGNFTNITANAAGLTDINASNITSGTISNARTTGSTSNSASTLVLRDSNGSFGSNVITASSFSGDGTAITAINASNISSGTIANARTTAASANGASTIVQRDSGGNFSANTVTAAVIGDLSGGTNINASNISSGTIANARTTASSSNGASTIVLRGASGEFAAGAITGSLFTGNGSAISAINASNISTGTIDNARTTAASANGASTIVARDAGGNFSANTITATTFSGAMSGNGAALTDINASNISSGTIANARTTAATANGASTIVLRGTSGEFSAGAITGASFTGNGAAISAINASNISTGTIDNARTSASASNGASTIVSRDAGGNFAAATITATTFSGAFSGNGSAISAINASNISTGTIANARTTASDANGASTIVSRDANGSFTANVVNATTFSGAFSGNGATLTNINASNISTGTIANARTTAATANGASTIVLRGTSGEFSAGAITGTFFIGDGSNVSAINGSNVTTGTVANARTTAASANGASTIVARDANGSFAGNVITGTTGTFTSVSGNGVALTAINASNITSGTVASARISGSYTGITGVGTLTAGTWNATTIAQANGGTGFTTGYRLFQSEFTSNINASTNRTVGAYGSYSSGATNTPTTAGILYNFTSGSDGSADGGQFWQDFSSNNLYLRQRWGGSYGSWLTILSASNYNSYSPTLTGGGASGTWAINISGSAASATTATTATTATNLSGGTVSATTVQATGGFTATSAAPFYTNATTVSSNYTVQTNFNAMSAGPITINSGVTVTVSTGSSWVIV